MARGGLAVRKRWGGGVKEGRNSRRQANGFDRRGQQAGKFAGTLSRREEGRLNHSPSIWAQRKTLPSQIKVSFVKPTLLG